MNKSILLASALAFSTSSFAQALTDSSPDKELMEAAKSGKLATREDYKREVTRILKSRNQYYLIDEAVERIGGADSFTNMPIRKMRFFREFFGYPNMLPIFKDNKRFGGDYTNAIGRLVSEADMLVEHIVNKDKNVFDELLTTKDFYVFHSGDNQAMEAYAQRIRKIYDYFKDKDWQNFTDEDLKQHKAFLDEVGGMRGVDIASIGGKKGDKDMTNLDPSILILLHSMSKSIPPEVLREYMNHNYQFFIKAYTSSSCMQLKEPIYKRVLFINEDEFEDLKNRLTMLSIDESDGDDHRAGGDHRHGDCVEELLVGEPVEVGDDATMQKGHDSKAAPKDEGAGFREVPADLPQGARAGGTMDA